MKSGTKIFITLLIAGNIVLGFFLYLKQKESEALLVRLKSGDVFSVSSFELGADIEELEKLKSDTGSENHKNGVYKDFINRGEFSGLGYRLFVLITSLHDNKKNENDLNKLAEEYCIQHSKIQYSFVAHPNFSDLKNEEVDSLINYIGNLKTITKKLEDMEIEP
jgi:hypothetical protein